MKRFIIFILLLFIVPVSHSEDWILPDNLNFALNNSTRVEIKIVGAAQSGSSFLFHTKNQSTFEYYKTETSTNPFTFNDVDGITNSASRLTATAGNGTILQSINTLTSDTHIYSVWLKRISGTGSIDLTDDNGVNWTTKTLTGTPVASGTLGT